MQQSTVDGGFTARLGRAARGRSRSRVMLAGCVFAILVSSWPSQCVADEAYPNRTIKVIVPFSPGGSTDAMARHVKREIEERELLPQPMVIINVEGAGSAIGSRRAKNAEPDGYTLMVLNEAIITSKYWGSVPYGPEAFEPIAATGEAGTVLTVHEDTEYDTLDKLLTAAKEHPREIRAAVALGTPSHFACLSAQAALPGAELLHAQVGGGAHRFAALKGKHVDITTFSTDEFLRFREDGLLGLAYLGKERSKDLPDVPTALEQGYNVQRSIMLYWWAPKGTPADRLDVIGDALEQAMQGEALKSRLRANSVDPIFLRGDALREKLNTVEADIQSIDPRRQVALPNMIIWTLGLMAVFAAWSALESRKKQPVASRTATSDSEADNSQADNSQADTPTEPPPHALRIIAAFLLTVAFVALLAGRVAPLWLALAVYMLAVGAFLGAFRSRALAASLLLLTGIIAASFHYLFTQLFVIDL